MNDTVVYMIEQINNQFWTNNGFKKDHGNLYRTREAAQKQIDKGKLAMFIGHSFGQVAAEHIKISKFNLTRSGE